MNAPIGPILILFIYFPKGSILVFINTTIGPQKNLLLLLFFLVSFLFFFYFLFFMDLQWHL